MIKMYQNITIGNELIQFQIQKMRLNPNRPVQQNPTMGSEENVLSPISHRSGYHLGTKLLRHPSGMPWVYRACGEGDPSLSEEIV